MDLHSAKCVYQVFDHPCVEGVTAGTWGRPGPARAGRACLGPDAAASVQAWHWDI